MGAKSGKNYGNRGVDSEGLRPKTRTDADEIVLLSLAAENTIRLSGTASLEAG
jgi:hypothetical protein